MRIHLGQLQEFVPAQFAVPQNPFLAPGMAGVGDFVGASYVVPQNPILDAAGLSGLRGLADFVAANYAVPQNPIVLNSGVGDMVGTASMYPIPINSVQQEVQDGTISGLGAYSSDGCGCGCGGGCSGGMGDISDFLTTQWANIQTGDPTTLLLWGGGAIVLGMLLFGGANSPGRRVYRKVRRAA